MLSTSIFWLHYLNRTAEAVQLCYYVAEQIIPEIGEEEFMTLSFSLLPIACVLKGQGEEDARKALDLYTKHVAHPLKKAGKNVHPAPVLITPVMMVILNCQASIGKYEGMEDDISWLLDGDEDKVPAWLESAAITYIDWAFSSLLCEACLLLANKFESDDDYELRSQLVKEGIRYSAMTEKSLKDEEGNDISVIAYAHHSALIAQLDLIQFK
jgi:hypothetical protein